MSSIMLEHSSHAHEEPHSRTSAVSPSILTEHIVSSVITFLNEYSAAVFPSISSRIALATADRAFYMYSNANIP